MLSSIQLNRLFKRKKAQKIALVVAVVYVAILFLMSVFANYIAPYNPYTVNLNQIFLPPSFKHLMGTDYLGRDVFSRILYGARYSLGASVLAVALALVIGSLIAFTTAYIGGYLDRAFNIVMDTMYTFPLILIAIMIAFVIGKGFYNVAISVAIAETPRFYRVVRSSVISVKNRGFIEAAKISNVPLNVIIYRHILLLVIPPLAVMAALTMSDAILSISILGFLSLGIPPPIPEWGADLSVNRSALLVGAWWALTFPGLMILITSFAFLLISEMYNEITIKGAGEI